MKPKNIKPNMWIYSFLLTIFFLINYVYSAEIKILYTHNLQEILNDSIKTNVNINKNLFIKNLMITFYKNKNSNSKDFNKEMVMVYDLKNNKMLYNLALSYTRFKDAITVDDKNLLIISWKPVKVYSFNIQTKKSEEIYENNPEKDKILFTLDSRITKDFSKNIISTVDIRNKNPEITDDVPFSLLKLINNKLEIIPWASRIKLNQDIKTFLNKDKINSLYYFVYPNIILANVDSNKLLKIETNQEYKGRNQEFNIKEISSNVGVLADYKDNNLLLIKKDGLYLLENYDKERQIFKGKVLKARFLDKNNYLYLVLDKQVKLYINNNLISNNFPYILLNEVENENDGYSLICSDNKKIIKIHIKI